MESQDIQLVNVVDANIETVKDFKPSPACGDTEAAQDVTSGDLNSEIMELVNSDNLQWGHLKHIMVTGAGFFADSYDLFVVNMVLVLLKDVYGQTDADKTMVACTAIWGAVIGQLGFGLLADVIGRKTIFLTTTALMIFGSVMSACTFQNDTFTVYQQIAFWRFFMGIGVGGEYPLAASITSESVGARLQGPMLASVFSMQSFGQITGCLVIIILLSCGVSEEVTWRIALAFGAVPGLIVFGFRASMQETILYKDVKEKRKSRQLSYPMAAKLAVKAFWWPLIGTATTWFLLDIFFYGNSLFNGSITQAMGLSKSAFDTALRSLYICLFALPGYILAIFTVNPLGRWNIQLGGFIIVSILYFSLAIWYDELTQESTALIIVYGMCYFFKNFGPNATTYIIPGEYYPSEVKGTLHGFSAAMGKVGAGIAANAFPYMLTAVGVANMMYFCASLAVAGAIFTAVFVPRYHWTKLREQQAERMALFYSARDKVLAEPVMPDGSDSPDADSDDVKVVNQSADVAL